MGYTKHKRQIKYAKQSTRKQRLKREAPVDNARIEVTTGGKVINSGGYGCVFKPALKCRDKPRDRGKVSKLMTTRHSQEEYDFIMKYKKKLEHIPNYADYFLLEGITICAPDKLTPSDLTYYKKKCTALQKDDITSLNINDNIDNVLVINMPDGGVDVGDYLFKHHSEGALIQLNNSLIDLLNNGIAPMNRQHIYHCDIKETNILVQPKRKSKKTKEEIEGGIEDKQNKLYTRLIDWGISVEHIAGSEIAEKLMNRPLQYNIPFSIVFFNKRFTSMYGELLKHTPSPSYKEIKDTVKNFMAVWFDERGMGHFHAISQTLQLLMLNDDPEADDADDTDDETSERTQKHRDDKMFTYYYIVDYLVTILSKYTMYGELKLMKYFDEVFIKNADIWGFIMTYGAIIERYFHNYEKLNEQELTVFNKLRQIIVSFLFETAVTPINHAALTRELQSLTELFKACRGVPSEYRDYQMRNRSSQYSSIFDKLTENANQ
jgi:hypothetical protein